ncbi:MAG TPA: ATP-binding cassette domain-containing protein, partial [Acidimicrobiales bacterium]|nr:ATP-binding cassette domain-containing protein [Acidimicrobiales bacterium]
AAVDPVAGAALLAAALALVAVSAGLSEVGRRAAARAAAARGELADAVLEAVTAAPELAVYGRSDLLAGELARVGRSARSASAREAAVTGVSRAAATMLAAGGLMAVVAAGLRAHDAGRLSGVMLAVVTFAALAVFDQCLGLPGALAGIQSGAAAERRLGELGAARPPVDEVPVDERLPRRPADVVVRGLEVLPAPAGDAPAALSAVSLELPPGRRLAVVGPSGSGKTTLIHTILHFLSPSRGSVAIGGAEVGGLTRRRLAELVGWLPEENHVFAASLGENLRLADPGATDEQCAEALGRVGLGPWYRALGGGLRTPLGAGGQPLSAGERQRLAMARLLLAGGDVLLLDEPTAHVDPWSARRLASELIEAASERSVLVTGHDPHLAQLVDRVVELDADWDVEPDHERPAS